MTAKQTAIVTGASKRVGAEIAGSTTVTDGWSVVAHVHHPEVTGRFDGRRRRSSPILPDRATARTQCSQHVDCASAGQACWSTMRRVLPGTVLASLAPPNSTRTWRSNRPRTRAAYRRVGAAASGRRRAGGQFARFEARCAEPRLCELHPVKHALAALTRPGGEGARPAGHMGQRDRSRIDASIEWPDRGEFRRHALGQSTATRSRAGRCCRGYPLPGRR